MEKLQIQVNVTREQVIYLTLHPFRQVTNKTKREEHPLFFYSCFKAFCILMKR